MQGMQKKGACLAHILIGKKLFCARGNLLVCQFFFGCDMGELRPGLSGWMQGNAEVLELLAFWKPEQQAAHRFRIWRPPFETLRDTDIFGCRTFFFGVKWE